MKPILTALLLLSLGACAGIQSHSRSQLIGHWRYSDATQSCDYSFRPDGSFSGEVRQRTKIVSRFTGRWTIKGTGLVYTYVNDAFGRIPPGTLDRDELLEVKNGSFVIQAANGDRRRYRRIQ